MTADTRRFAAPRARNAHDSRRATVAPLLAAGLSVRAISAETGIPIGAVHRAKRQLEKIVAQQPGQKAAAISFEPPLSYWFSGILMAFGKTFGPLSLIPSSSTALYWGAIIHASSGNFAAATAYANRALRLSPFDPVAFAAHSARHLALPKRCKNNPRFSSLYFFQAAALALAGRAEGARPIVGQGLELPGFRFSEVLEHALHHRALKDEFIEGARLLGLPE
jgi:tetratricopeptide (TPR) repeat protein